MPILAYIAFALIAIVLLILIVHVNKLENRCERLQEQMKMLMTVHSSITDIVEATERMSTDFVNHNKWMMDTADEMFDGFDRAICDLKNHMQELDKTYESLSKRNELLDIELRNTCKCCSDMQQRMELILTPPQIKPIPMPDCSNDPNQFQKQSVWDQVFHQNDSITKSTVPNCQTDPVGFLGKAIHVAQSTAAAMNGLKDLAETAVEAVKDSIDSVPDSDEFEPEEWLEDGQEEELGEGSEEATDDENL